MPATVIAERIGWEQGLTVLKDRVRVLRPCYLPPDPAQPSTALVFATPSVSVVSA